MSVRTGCCTAASRSPRLSGCGTTGIHSASCSPGQSPQHCSGLDDSGELDTSHNALSLRRSRAVKSIPTWAAHPESTVTQQTLMQWDDPIVSGAHGKWMWIVVRRLIRDLPTLTQKHHGGQRLCITAFDSGPITPSAEEQALGWTLMDDIMVSPPLTSQLDIPCDTHDE